MPTLLVIAAPAEFRAVAAGLRGIDADTISAPAAAVAGGWTVEPLAPGLLATLSGIGKANAAAATALALRETRADAVISIGIAGALPHPGGADIPSARGAAHPSAPTLALGACILATASIYADEGLQTPDAFRTCADLGFPLGPFAGSAVAPDPTLAARLRPLAVHTGPIATVSTCSGTDALAAQVAARTGALAEAMEGAAVGHVAARLGVPFAEIRVLSNTTGDRDRQRWDLPGALEGLRLACARLGSPA